jgi:hypothetical protein
LVSSEYSYNSGSGISSAAPNFLMVKADRMPLVFVEFLTHRHSNASRSAVNLPH